MNTLSPEKVTSKVKDLTDTISRVVLTSTKGTAVTKAAVHRRKQSSSSGAADSPDPVAANGQREEVTDAYGFQISQTASQAAATNRCAQQEEKQRAKWKQYPQEGGLPPEDRLKKLCRRGIPPELRKWVWMEVSGANDRRLAHTPTYYISLAQKGKRESPMAHQIRLDTPRTFPNNGWLQSEPGQAAISRVLFAFSLHNPRIGYCQGLNYVVAILLLALGHDEEAAFWLVASLIDNEKGILYQDMYSSDLSGTHVEMRSLMELVDSKLSRLATHMENLHCDMSIISTDWFLCLFSTSLPSETVVRVWDALLNEGPKILFRVALALLKLHEPALLATDNAGELLKTIRRAASDEFDRDELMAVAFEGVGSLSMSRIDKYREFNQKQVDTEFAERQTRTNLRKAIEEQGFVLDETEADLLVEDSSAQSEDVYAVLPVKPSPKKTFSLKHQLSSISDKVKEIKHKRSQSSNNIAADEEATGVTATAK